MVTIYTYNLLIAKYINDKSLSDLSLVNKYWMLVSKEQRLLRKAKNQGWNKLAEQYGLKDTEELRDEARTDFAKIAGTTILDLLNKKKKVNDSIIH